MTVKEANHRKKKRLSLRNRKIKTGMKEKNLEFDLKTTKEIENI